VAGAATLALIAAGLVAEISGALPGHVGRGVASAAVHGGFLAAGWMMATDRAPWHGPLLWSMGALAAASVASRVTEWGALLYLLPPAVLLRSGRQCRELRAIGWRATAGLRHAALGLAGGAFLGIHLLISASFTLGYAVSLASPAQYLSAVAYDVGANGLTAEWLFRGALFSRLWRRWPFWPAASLSTAMAVARYLVDPALPAAIEVRVGAVFYTALLGVGACVLRAESGSLLPGYLGTIAFFAAYRLLSP